MQTSTGPLPEVTTASHRRSTATLRGDFVWTLIGNGIYAASQWAILVLLAKKGSPELVGRYSFAVAVATPVIAFANLQLRSVQVTDIADQNSFRDYLGFRIWTVAAAMVILTAICLGMRYPLTSTLLIELVGVALAIETISDLYYGVMQIHGHMDRIAKSMITRGLLSLGAILVVLNITGSLAAALLALAATRLIICIFYDMHFGIKRLPTGHDAESASDSRLPCWDRKRQLNILSSALPIGVVALLVSLNTSIPRYFIQWALGARQLGIFSALCFFSSSGNMISTALGQAAFARLATAYGRRELRTFLTLLCKLLLVGAGLAFIGIVGASVWGAELLRILYKPEYAEQSRLLVVLMLATGLGYFAQFVGTAVTAARAFSPQIPLFLTVGITLTLTSYWLVPSGGLHGAMVAIMITNIVQFLGSAVILSFVLKRSNMRNVFTLANRPSKAYVSSSNA